MTQFTWPEGVVPPEDFLLFRCRGGRTLKLASTHAYELWLDGRFVGDGGHRSSPGKAPLDVWEAAKTANDVVVRVHYIDAGTTLYLRQAHADPFLWVEDAGTWTCHRDASIRTTSTKASLQLPRQNIVTGAPAPGVELALHRVERAWQVIDFGIQRARIVQVVPRVISTAAVVECRHFPELPGTWSKCTSYDLGEIGLHRVEVAGGPVLLCYSEVPDFAEVWATPHRADVLLVDSVTDAAPFGWRGCRYVHVLHATQPTIRAWRREYPLRFRDLARDDAIVDACRANLRACVDGGVVDTCWRERAQWTGDLRMSAAALRALADNDEVVTLALSQIADGYDASLAMVPAVAPASLPRPCIVPGYHQAFCLTVAEHGANKVPRAAAIARASLVQWTDRYVHAGVLDRFPDGLWWFVDWDPTRRFDPRVPDDPSSVAGPDAVTHCWFQEACARFGVASRIDVAAFDAKYWSGTAYRLHASGPESPQATAAAALAFATHRDAAIDWLLAQHQQGEIGKRVTPYFLTFVARAIALRSKDHARRVVREVLGPRIARLGTIPEKVTDSASLAHGWSVGFASLFSE